MQAFSPHNVTAVKQLTPTTVQVRYGDGKAPVVLTNTTSSEVLARIEEAKADRR